MRICPKIRRLFAQQAAKPLSKPLIWTAASICALLPALASAQASSPTRELQALFSRAQAAQSVRDYADAARDYEAMLKLRPGVPEIQVNLGLMDHLAGNYRQAVENFEAALREKPDLFAPNLFLGVDLLHIRRPRRALIYLRKADHLNPNNLQVKLALARAYAGNGEFENANKNYFLAAVIAPGNLDAGFGLGITYMRLQQTAAERLASVGGSSIYARMLLAESLAHEGGLTEGAALAKDAKARDSLRIYRQLLVSHPGFGGLHTAAGFDELRLGNPVQARVEFKKELVVGPGFLPARLGLAELDLEASETSAAARRLEGIWRTDGNFLRAHIGSICGNTGARKPVSLDRNLKTIAQSTSNPGLKQLLESNLCDAGSVLAKHVDTARVNRAGSTANLPRVPSAATPDKLYADGRYTACAGKLRARIGRLGPSELKLLARCSYETGDYRTVFRAAGNVLQADPNDAEALYWRAKSSMKLSLAALLSTGNAHPDSLQAHLLLGQAYLTVNRFQEARVQYQMALALSPGSLAAKMGLGLANWKEGNFDKALENARSVLAANPKDSQASYIAGEILTRRHEYAQARPYLLRAATGMDKMALYAHALLSKADAAQGRMSEAVLQLKRALKADDDGSLHFQLYQLYRKLGETQAASAALEQSKLIRSRQAERAEALIDFPH